MIRHSHYRESLSCIRETCPDVSDKHEALVSELQNLSYELKHSCRSLGNARSLIGRWIAESVSARPTIMERLRAFLDPRAARSLPDAALQELDYALETVESAADALREGDSEQGDVIDALDDYQTAELTARIDLRRALCDAIEQGKRDAEEAEERAAGRAW